MIAEQKPIDCAAGLPGREAHLWSEVWECSRSAGMIPNSTAVFPLIHRRQRKTDWSLVERSLTRILGPMPARRIDCSLEDSGLRAMLNWPSWAETLSKPQAVPSSMNRRSFHEISL